LLLLFDDPSRTRTTGQHRRAGGVNYLYAITVLKKNERQDERGSLYEQALRMVEEYPIEQIPSRVSLQHANKHSVNVILVQGETNAKDRYRVLVEVVAIVE